MSRPRLLLVPSMTELYWMIRPLLDEWADVASYDPPGVGVEPPEEGPVLSAIARRGRTELEKRGWTRCVVVGDAFGGAAAIELARLAPDRVAGLVLGHATLSYRRHGPRPPLDPQVGEALDRIMELDYRASLRQEVAIWDPRRGAGFTPASDELVERIAERLPASTWRNLSTALFREAEAAGDMEPILREIDVPLMLAKHKGCVSYTEEGFADAAKAFPDAQTVSCSARPTLSEEFTAALREFCARVW